MSELFSGTAVAVIAILGVVVVGQLGLLAYLIPRRERISDKYDDARDKVDDLLKSQASTSIAHAEQIDALTDRIDVMTEEQKMLLSGLEAEKQGRRQDAAARGELERQRDDLLEAIKKGGGEPATVALAIREQLRRLREVATAPARPPSPPAPPNRRG
jgi:F0F1-type ATP synthase membrane subunit b/b'